MGSRHAENLRRRIPGARLVAVADVNLERARSIGAELGVDSYDRTEALVRMGKVVISVDLNPLSRTSKTATVPVVDELTRAIPNIEKFVRELHEDSKEAERIVRMYDRAGNLRASYSFLSWRLRTLLRGPKKKR